MAEVNKALTLLDCGRRGRAQEKKMARMKQAMSTAGHKGKSRIGKRLVEAKKKLNNVTRDTPSKGKAISSSNQYAYQNLVFRHTQWCSMQTYQIMDKNHIDQSIGILCAAFAKRKLEAVG